MNAAPEKLLQKLVINPTDKFLQVGRRDRTARRTDVLTGEFLEEMREYSARIASGAANAAPQEIARVAERDRYV